MKSSRYAVDVYHRKDADTDFELIGRFQLDGNRNVVVLAVDDVWGDFLRDTADVGLVVDSGSRRISAHHGPKFLEVVLRSWGGRHDAVGVRAERVVLKDVGAEKMTEGLTPEEERLLSEQPKWSQRRLRRILDNPTPTPKWVNPIGSIGNIIVLLVYLGIALGAAWLVWTFLRPSGFLRTIEMVLLALFLLWVVPVIIMAYRIGTKTDDAMIAASDRLAAAADKAQLKLHQPAPPPDA